MFDAEETNDSQTSNSSSSCNSQSLNSLSFEQLLKCLKHNDLRIKEIDLFFLTWQWIKETLLINPSSLSSSSSSSPVKSFSSNSCSNSSSSSCCSGSGRKKKKLGGGNVKKKRKNCETKMVSHRSNIKMIRCLMRQIRFALIEPNDLVHRVQGKTTRFVFILDFALINLD